MPSYKFNHILLSSQIVSEYKIITMINTVDDELCEETNSIRAVSDDDMAGEVERKRIRNDIVLGHISVRILFTV